MKKINCRIISVRNTDNIRYSERNKLIDQFLELNIPNFDIKVSDAVKPTDWWIEDNKVFYNGELFKMNERSAHTHGITNYLSHYKIWTQLGEILILEDDIIYDINLFDKISSIIEKFNNIKIENKILNLQSSCPWRTGFPDKSYAYVYDFSEDFYLLNNKIINDVSGTAAYYINLNSKLLETLKREIGATDGIIDNLLRTNELFYFIPKDFNSWFKLNKQVQ